MPMMPLSGVRISWLAIARKRDLARLAALAWSRASLSARSVSVRSVTSRPTLCISAGRPASLRTNPSRQAIQRGVALFENGERGPAADQFFARQAGELAIGIVGEGDKTLGVAQHDQIALG